MYFISFLSQWKKELSFYSRNIGENRGRKKERKEEKTEMEDGGRKGRRKKGRRVGKRKERREEGRERGREKDGGTLKSVRENESQTFRRVFLFCFVLS